MAKRTEIIIPQIIGTQNIDLERVTRNHFEDSITGKADSQRDYFEEISYKLDSVLEKAGLSERDVDTILQTPQGKTGSKSDLNAVQANATASQLGQKQLMGPHRLC